MTNHKEQLINSKCTCDDCREPELLPCPFWTDKYVLKKETNCWEWIGAKSGNGYGHTSVKGVHKLCHRVSYEQCYGVIPEGLTVDHICRNRACINPQHLRLLTLRDNILCGECPPAINKRRTHCVNGHEFNKENTRIKKRKDGDHRECKKCHLERETKRYYRSKKNEK